MPAFPEIAAVGGFIRRIEVRREMKTHEETQTDGDVCIAGEIGIDLQGIEEECADGFETSEEMGIVKDSVNEIHRKIIRKNDLLHKTVENPEDSHTELHAREVVLSVKLGNEVRCLDDRSCYQLWEETYIEAKVEDVADRLHESFVNICRITDYLKSIEGNTDGKDNLINGKDIAAKDLVSHLCSNIGNFEGRAEKLSEEVGEKVAVFEIAENAEIDEYTET